jgi:hypothetical protein
MKRFEPQPAAMRHARADDRNTHVVRKLAAKRHRAPMATTSEARRTITMWASLQSVVDFP